MQQTKSHKNVFDLLDLTKEYNENQALFSQKYDKINENDCLQRIVFIVKLYKKWIDAKQNNQEEDESSVESVKRQSLVYVDHSLRGYILGHF